MMHVDPLLRSLVRPRAVSPPRMRSVPSPPYPMHVAFLHLAFLGPCFPLPSPCFLPQPGNPASIDPHDDSLSLCLVTSFCCPPRDVRCRHPCACRPPVAVPHLSQIPAARSREVPPSHNAATRPFHPREHTRHTHRRKRKPLTRHDTARRYERCRLSSSARQRAWKLGRGPWPAGGGGGGGNYLSTYLAI